MPQVGSARASTPTGAAAGSWPERETAAGEASACPKTFRQHPDAYSYAVADQITPQEPVAQHQPADSHSPDVVYPGGVVELADFDGETKQAGRRRDTLDGEAWEEEGHRQVSRQSPQSIPGVFLDRRGQRRRIRPGGEAEQDDGQDQDRVFESAPSHITPRLVTSPSPVCRAAARRSLSEPRNQNRGGGDTIAVFT